MWELHTNYLRVTYGEERLDAMNVGWGNGDDFIETKVYATETEPAEVAITRMTRKGKGVTYICEVEPYKNHDKKSEEKVH